MTRGSADGQVEAEIESQRSRNPPGGRLGRRRGSSTLEEGEAGSRTDPGGAELLPGLTSPGGWKRGHHASQLSACLSRANGGFLAHGQFFLVNNLSKTWLFSQETTAFYVAVKPFKRKFGD